MYVLIQNDAVIEYPTSVNAWREKNKNVSLPLEPTESQLNEVGIFEVSPSARPLDTMGNIVEEATPELIDGVWTQKWMIRQATPSELAVQNEMLLNKIVDATQLRLDVFAQSRNYSDIKSACTYIGCPIQKFDIEGIYCRDIRALTWAKLYEILAEVQAGTRPAPTSYEEIEPELPVLQWPN